MSKLSLEQAAKILGIEKTATDEEIKKAFKKKSLEHHPDRGGEQKQFVLINHAYNRMMEKPYQQRIRGITIVDLEKFVIDSEMFGGDEEVKRYVQRNEETDDET